MKTFTVTTLNQTSLRIIRDKNTINRTPIHIVAKELSTTVSSLRNNYTGYAIIQGFNSLDDLIYDDLKRGLTVTQIANMLRQGV